MHTTLSWPANIRPILSPIKKFCCILQSHFHKLVIVYLRLTSRVNYIHDLQGLNGRLNSLYQPQRSRKCSGSPFRFLGSLSSFSGFTNLQMSSMMMILCWSMPIKHSNTGCPSKTFGNWKCDQNTFVTSGADKGYSAYHLGLATCKSCIKLTLNVNRR